MKYLLIIALALSGGMVGAYMFTDVVKPILGATTARTTITNQWTFSATTTQNKPLIVTTTNAATSTMQIGCIQTTATSTASPVKIVPVAISTTTTTFGNGTTGFLLVATFGTCPNLP